MLDPGTTDVTEAEDPVAEERIVMTREPVEVVVEVDKLVVVPDATGVVEGVGVIEGVGVVEGVGVAEGVGVVEGLEVEPEDAETVLRPGPATPRPLQMNATELNSTRARHRPSAPREASSWLRAEPKPSTWQFAP